MTINTNPNFQAFPARVTRISRFSVVASTMPNGQILDLQQCAYLLESCMKRTLINYRPVRYLFMEPAKKDQLIIEGSIFEAKCWKVAKKVHVELALRFTAKSDGQVLDVIEEQAISSDFVLPSDINPCSMVLALEPLVEVTMKQLAHRLSQSNAVNRGTPWHSVVIQVDQDKIFVDGGLRAGLETDNLLDIYRQVPAIPGPVYKYLTTIQVELVSKNDCQCKYYVNTSAIAQKDDCVSIHFP